MKTKKTNRGGERELYQALNVEFTPKGNLRVKKKKPAKRSKTLRERVERLENNAAKIIKKLIRIDIKQHTEDQSPGEHVCDCHKELSDEWESYACQCCVEPANEEPPKVKCLKHTTFYLYCGDCRENNPNKEVCECHCHWCVHVSDKCAKVKNCDHCKPKEKGWREVFRKNFKRLGATTSVKDLPIQLYIVDEKGLPHDLEEIETFIENLLKKEREQAYREGFKEGIENG